MPIIGPKIMQFFEPMLARPELKIGGKPKGNLHLAQGNALGLTMHNNGAPCKGKSIKSNNRYAL